MRTSAMQATCYSAFCQINSSPKRKRHWVGGTWPVSTHASGLYVAAALSRRWEGKKTLPLSPAIKWSNHNHMSSLDQSFLQTLCDICVKYSVSEQEGLALYSMMWRKAESFLSRRCSCQEPRTAGKLQSDISLVCKTSSRCSKNNIVEIFFFIDQYSVMEG